MEQQVLRQRYFSWQFSKLEQALDQKSAEGWQLTAATHKKQTFEQGGVPCRHRLGYCPAQKQTAGYISYVAAQERAGWELVCQEQGWLYFRKPLTAFAEGERQRLEEDREGIREMFTQITRKLENWRIAALILAFLLLVAGYATTNAVMRLAVIPLVLILLDTYLIKFLTESLENDALTD